MKKKIVGIFLVMLLLVTFVGCEKENKEEKAKISIDCSMTDSMYGGEYGNNLTAVTYVKAKFNADGYLAEAEHSTVETSGTDEIYKERKADFVEYEKSAVDTTIKYDDAKRTITMTTIDKPNYSLYNEEEKKELTIANQVKSLEERNYKCEIKGATRESLGL